MIIKKHKSILDAIMWYCFESLTDDIGKLKKKENVAILQSKRWNEILAFGEHVISEEVEQSISTCLFRKSIDRLKL